MKVKYGFLVILSIIVLLMINNVAYAAMADFTDEEADRNTQQSKEEWKNEISRRIEKSSNNYLQSLSVDGYSLNPKFDKQTVNYKVNDTVDTDTIIVNAKTDDEKATVSGTGTIKLTNGDNELRVDVTAENGTVRTYFIAVKTTKGEIVENTNTEDEVENNIKTDVPHEQQNKEVDSSNKDTKSYIIAIIVVFVILVLLVKSKSKKKRRRK